MRKSSLKFVDAINNIFYFFSYRILTISTILFFVFLILIQRSDENIVNDLQGKFIDKISPVISAIGDSISFIHKIGQFFEDIVDLYKQNQELKLQVDKMQVYTMLYDKVSAENKELKKLLNYTEDTPWHVMTARILINSNSLFSRNVIISVGQKNDVYKGQIITNESGLIGRVIEVYPSTSRVMLLNDVNSRIPVVSTVSRERAIVAGDGSNILRLLYLREGHKVVEGEMFISSGDGDLIPYGIPVGVAIKIDDKYKVRPFVNIDQMEYVSLISKDQ